MIRALGHNDVEEVAALYQRVVRGGGIPPDWLAPYFAETLLDHPWFDPELPSLVHAESNGAISGFIGVHARRIRFGTEAMRLACSGQFVVDPAIGGGRGLFLNRAFLEGPQDVAITDGANPAALAVWTRVGGAVRELESISWSVPLRPTRAAIDLLTKHAMPDRLRGVGATAGRAADAAFDRLAARQAPAHGLRTEQLDAEKLVSALSEITQTALIAPTHDLPFARWLLATLGLSSARGELRAMVVRGEAESALGAFVYYRRRDGVSRSMCLVAQPGLLPKVLDALIADARAGGASVLSGRLEPGLPAALAGHRSVLRHTGNALIHSRNQDLLRAIKGGESSLTCLEGEYWMAHHLDHVPETRLPQRPVQCPSN